MGYEGTAGGGGAAAPPSFTATTLRQCCSLSGRRAGVRGAARGCGGTGPGTVRGCSGADGATGENKNKRGGRAGQEGWARRVTKRTGEEAATRPPPPQRGQLQDSPHSCHCHPRPPAARRGHAGNAATPAAPAAPAGNSPPPAMSDSRRHRSHPTRHPPCVQKTWAGGENQFWIRVLTRVNAPKRWVRSPKGIINKIHVAKYNTCQPS